MKIVSASRRTDIPAFYSGWLMNRLREGYARVPNPFNSRQVSSVNLHPSEVACLVFWTKDPRPMLPHIEELERRGYRFYFQVTLTGLPRIFEPKVPEAAEVVAAIRELARRIGSDRIVWRFDPILFSRLTLPDRIIENFTALAEQLEGSVCSAVISFAREYRSTKARLRGAAPHEQVHFPAADSVEAKGEVADRLAAAGARHGLPIRSCAEPDDLTPFGIPGGSCIDADYINRLFGLDLQAGKDPGQRGACRCARSVDLGIYGSCPHGCLYCYASCGARLAGGSRHDPDADSLLPCSSPQPSLQPRLFGE